MPKLGYNEEWRVEIDLNYLHTLRVTANLGMDELPVASSTLWRAQQGQGVRLDTIAKLATFFQVEPGELIIWYPVPKEDEHEEAESEASGGHTAPLAAALG